VKLPRSKNQGLEPYRDNYYHDDPSSELFGKYSESVKSLSKTLSALVIFVFSALFLQATLAANINLNSQKIVEFGQGFSAYTACSGNQSLSIQPKNIFDGNAFYLKSVAVSNIPSSCIGNDFNLSAYGSSTSPNGSIAFVNKGLSSPYITATVPSPGSSSITYEWWFYNTSTSPATQGMLQTRTNSSNDDGIDVSIYSSNISVTKSGQVLLSGVGTISLNTWYHIAVVRNGATAWTVYLNGNSIGTFNYSTTTGTSLAIGVKSFTTYDEFFNGYISDFRYVSGSAVYTSNFTPPTSMLTSISGTKLLLETPNSSGFISDTSGNAVTITQVNSGLTSSSASPFPASTSPLSIFNSSSTNAIVYDTTTSFVQGFGSTGTTVTTNSTTPTGSFTVSFDSPVALAATVKTFTLQSLPHRTS